MVCYLKGVSVQPYTVALAKLAPDLESQDLVEWKWCHNVGWGWYSLQTASYILIRHIKVCLRHGYAVSRVYGCTLIRDTGQVAPRFWNSDSPEEWKWCHYIMVEADIHLRPLHTSIVDISKMFELLVCCLKGIWVHPYILTSAKLAPDLRSQGHLWSENEATMSWLRLISTSDHFIHPY